VISVSPENNIVVNGSYVHQPNGTLVVYSLAPSSKKMPVLVVSGNVTLAGTLQYSVASNPASDTKYSIITGNSISGNFSAEDNVVYDSDDVALGQLQFSVKYSPQEVVIELQPSYQNNLFGLPLWIWAIIGGSVFMIVVTITLVRRRRLRRKKKGYAPISD